MAKRCMGARAAYCVTSCGRCVVSLSHRYVLDTRTWAKAKVRPFVNVNRQRECEKERDREREGGREGPLHVRSHHCRPFTGFYSGLVEQWSQGLTLLRHVRWPRLRFRSREPG